MLSAYLRWGCQTGWRLQGAAAQLRALQAILLITGLQSSCMALPVFTVLVWLLLLLPENALPMARVLMGRGSAVGRDSVIYVLAWYVMLTAVCLVRLVLLTFATKFAESACACVQVPPPCQHE